MELEEMKSLWGEMSAEIERQKKVSDLLIIQLISSEYKKKLTRILIPELIGIAICILAVGVIALNFKSLTTWYLEVCGIISILVLLFISAMSVKSAQKIHSVNISRNNFREVLFEYAQNKKDFVFVQKMNFYAAAVLLHTILPVMGAVIAGKDLFMVTRLWWWYAVGYPFFFGFAGWVFRSYAKTTEQAQRILMELEK